MEFNVTLAHKRNAERLDVSQGVFIQPKLDGVRCYTRLVDGEVKMFSRNHREFKNVKHILTELKSVFAINPNIVLDGELYNHKYRDNFNKIISLVRKQKPTQADKFEASSSLQYHVYDIYLGNLPNLRYNDRLRAIRKMFNNFRFRATQPVDTIKVNTQELVNEFEQKFLDLGYEGAMLRANIPYEQRRSHGLQKVKRFHDSEFQIRGFVEGKGKFAGGLGKFLGFCCETGIEVEVPFQKCTIAERKEIWQNKDKYYGQIATFEWFEKTPSGAYRFPQFKGLRNYE